MIQFTIHGAPGTTTAQQKGTRIVTQNGKPRPIYYTKREVACEKLRFAVSVIPHRPKAPLDGPLVVELAFVFPLTKQAIAANVSRLEDEQFVLWKPSRPDVDNSAKLLMDTLTENNFWHDDAQVCDLQLRKRSGSCPRIEVRIREAIDDDLPLRLMEQLV